MVQYTHNPCCPSYRPAAPQGPNGLQPSLGPPCSFIYTWFNSMGQQGLMTNCGHITYRYLQYTWFPAYRDGTLTYPNTLRHIVELCTSQFLYGWVGVSQSKTNPLRQKQTCGERQPSHLPLYTSAYRRALQCAVHVWVSARVVSHQYKHKTEYTT